MTKPKPITWTTEQVRLGDLVPWEKNPRIVTEQQGAQIRRSLDEFGLAEPLVVNFDRVSLIGGHARRLLLLEDHGPDHVVDVRVPSRKLSDREAERLALRLNRNTGGWDWDRLANEFEVEDLVDVGFDEADFAPDPPPDPSKAADASRTSSVTCPKCGHAFEPKKAD